MKMISRFVFLCVLCAVVKAAEPPWRYQLLEGSFLVDDCLICGRPSIQIPMRGSFTLRRVEVTPISQRYVIENAEFKAGPDYTFKGNGTYTITGDFAIRQTVTLGGTLQTAGETKSVGFTNEENTITRRWPMLYATLRQTNGTLANTITLTIAAAPLREIWFSTATNFVRAIKLDNTVSDGDLLSSVGRIVKRNSDLQEHFPGPTFLNMGLDAIDVLPGADIVFSTESKGVLNDGDFASARTGAITRWQDFMSIVAPGVTNDPGLDALHFESPNKFYFSTKQNIPDAPTPIGNGDIVQVDMDARTSDIFRSNANLLSQFHPAEAKDYGLDALYIWPNGEIWFSTTTDFSDSQLGTITAGDLLSDAGYIVYRNADLVAALQPMASEPTDYGLDAVFVISDSTAAEPDARLSATFNGAEHRITIAWQSQARVFQVEHATDVDGPWEATTPIIPELSYEDFVSANADTRAFYRVLQW